MSQLLLCLFCFLPVVCFAQGEVGPDRYSLLLILALVLVIPILIYGFEVGLKKRKINLKGWFAKGRIETKLLSNQKITPDVLTLVIRNTREKTVCLEAPVLIIRKLWSVRKFRLKGINRAEIYPLSLESGRRHELQLKLDVFHKHDPALRSYYWARVQIKDTTGKTYSTKYITLRKSLIN